MRNILTKIKPGNDDYPLTHLTCFEKPFGIAVEGLASGHSSLFYMYLKLLTTHECLITDYDLYDLCSEILPKLGFRLNLFRECDPILLIEEQIAAGRPVLVPGNLRELYYSSHFDATDWPHMFLITGYDKEHELFSVIDGTQKRSNEHNYEEFVIPYPIIDKMYRSYLRNYASETGIVSLERTEQAIDIPRFIEESLDLYVAQRSDAPPVEIAFFEALTSSPSPSIDLSTNLLLKHINYKEVYYSELFALLTRYSRVDPDDLNRMKDKVNSLAEKWRKAITRYAVHFKRGKTGSWREITVPAFQEEADMCRMMQELRERLSHHAACWIEERGSLWIYENNRDKLIAGHGTRLLFHFANSKLYNSWINDESPKALLNQDLKGRNWLFSCEVCADATEPETEYHGGIVLRSTTGELFFWGIYRGESLVLQKIGDDHIPSTVLLSAKRFILELEHAGGLYMFRYGYSRDEVKEVYRTTALKPVDQLGVGCKTWGTYKPLTLTFSDVGVRLQPS
ncbi:hypothetical protein PSTEL_11945 [Paenibacillus stellifer]|uniref:Butirosin biosynthesis protein H N-terminal domain-containing protein n=1 Tax=Paenibacillus stellifer TaxID=169760 RepID=A0A089LRZ0_9BACL|nr:hypothetical protein PSTEL_11945 [Paenibacillus stellifer]